MGCLLALLLASGASAAAAAPATRPAPQAPATAAAPRCKVESADGTPSAFFCLSGSEEKTDATDAPAKGTSVQGTADKAPAPKQGAAQETPAKKLLARARAERLAGQPRDAFFTSLDAFKADPADPEVVFELGVGYALLGYYRDAIAYWERVLTMDVDDGTRASARQNIAKAKQKLEASRPDKGR
jgi:tetratricopeptide (TPR) repeat protein